MNNLNDSPAKKSFWKINSAVVPGSSITSPPTTNVSARRHKLSFKEFENHTEDAWDTADDDLLKNALAKIDICHCPDQVHATAQAVIDHHSRTSLIPQDVYVEPVTTSANELQTTNSAAESRIAPKTLVQSAPSASKPSKSSTKRFPGGASRTLSKSDPEDIREVSSNKLATKKHIGPIVATDKNGHSENTKSSIDKVKNEDEKGLTQNEDGDKNHKLETKFEITLHPPDPDKAGSAPRSQTIRMPMEPSNRHKENYRIKKFKNLISSESTDLGGLRELSWSGIPSSVRAMTWQLLSGYLPANRDRRETVLTRKRKEYFNFVDEYYPSREQPMYQSTFHQIHIDIPRTNPLVPLFQQPTVQNIFERLLFVWAVRHPASGYVQGINDLVTPFFVVFLTFQIGEERDVETYDVSTLPDAILKEMEADTFWCLSNLLDGIQDNYTFAQPGVQTKVSKLRELIRRVDAELHAHLEAEGIEYLQFAFRWMNNLLMREIPLRCTIRLWDTYLAEDEGFSDFHLYSCAAFLKQWRAQLLAEKDFQDIMLMIQNVPTHHWGEEEIKLLLAEAFRLKYTFADAPSHLPGKR